MKIMNDVKEKVVDEIFNKFKRREHLHYNEEVHCKLLINVMLDRDKGTLSAFCVESLIPETTFYLWLNTHSLFKDIYYFTKMLAKENWEEEGRRIRDREYQMGTINHEFEYWKMMGWTRFGISKNSRIKLNLNPNDSPIQHYKQLLQQASEGDFTTAELKQLMEAINVGLNTHQVFELQKQIDELKSDLETMQANSNVQNPFSNKGIAQKD